MKQSGKICNICRTEFYKIRKTCDSYDSQRENENKVQKVQQEDYDSSSHYEVDASISNAAIEI